MWVALVLALQQESPEKLYKLKPGTTAVLEQVRLGRKSRVDLKVLREDDGKLLVESTETADWQKDPRIETTAWWMEDGILLMGPWRAGKAEPLFRLYKTGAKKDETWVGSAGALGDVFTAQHMGTVDVTVPAGTYKNVYWVRISSKSGGDLAMSRSIEFFLAPNVGLVKIRIVEHETETSVTELQQIRTP